MFGLHKTIYSTATLEDIAESYRSGSTKQLAPRILGTTISHAITVTRDTLSSLEQMTQDPRTIRGEATHMNRTYARRKGHLRLQDMNAQTDSVRDAHFTAMAEEFKNLDYTTNVLGAAVSLLATHLANSLNSSCAGSGDVMKQVALFIPEAHYNSSTGKIEFRVAGGDYASLTSFRELQELQKNVGEESKLTQSLLELKVTGAALRASIDAGTLYAVKDVRDYPSDTHSEVMDAVQTVEANLGFLSSLELPHDLSKLIKRSIPGRFTQWLQVYVDHKTNPWYARIAGAAGLIGGAASLIVGVPQMAYWASQGTIDLTYNPIIPNRIGNTTALVLTGEGFGAVTFSLLTLGSDIGSKLVRDIRKLQFHSLREV